MGGERDDLWHKSIPDFKLKSLTQFATASLLTEGQAPLHLHPVPDAPKLQNFYDPGFQFYLVHWEGEVCFPSLPPWASNYCVYQFMFL